MLTRISTAFDAPGDPDEAIESIAEELQRQLGVRECSIWLLDSDSGELLRQHAAGPERGRAAGWRASLAGGVGGGVVEGGEGLIVAEAPAGVAASEGAGEPARAILSVPLKTQCRTIGVLELADTLPHRFDAEFLARVQPLATLAAIALETAGVATEHGRLACLLSRVAQSPHMGVAVVDMDRTVLQWNAGAEALTGYPSADVVGSDDVWQALLPDAAQAASDLRAPIAEQLSTICTRSGETRIVSWHSEPLTGREGLVVGAVLLARDVTVQARAELEMRHALERLEALRKLDAALLGTRSPSQVAEAAMAHLPALLPCGWTCMALIDAHTEQIAPLASRIDAGGVDLPSAGALVWMLAFIEQLQQGVAVQVDDLAATGAPGELQQAWERAQVRFLRMWPLRMEDDLLGVLCLGVADAAGLLPADAETGDEIAGLLTVALQRALLFDQTSEDRTRLQQLSRRLLAQHEEERRRVARELHDEIGQTLAGLKLGWESIARAPAGEEPAGQAAWVDVTNSLLTQVRELSSELRPTMLDDLGVVPALLWLFERFTDETGVSVSFSHAGVERRFDAEIETAFYRMAQEGIRNVAQHADTDEAIVHLWTEENVLCMRITDHGAGFDPQTVMQAYPAGGLAGMAERATLLGGYLTVESEPGAGATVTAKVPLSRNGTRIRGESGQ